MIGAADWSSLAATGVKNVFSIKAATAKSDIARTGSGHTAS
jgi:hypothetical protein